MSEPLFHYFDDCLPDDHPLLVSDSIHCVDCRAMLHCINEVMTAWFETGIGPICLACFTKRYETLGDYTIYPFDELEISNA